MKELLVPYIALPNRGTSPEEVSSVLNRLQLNRIDVAGWPAFSYKPDASFILARGADCLFLKYFVREGSVKAQYIRTNDPVFKDSCVEFFVSFDGQEEYYNLEFNCLGTCRMAFGAGRNNRKFLSEKQISKIRPASFFRSSAAGDIYWELTLVIPAEVFVFHRISSFSGISCRGNFYKCGDDLPAPHFLSWNAVHTEHPDFHQPEFFGRLCFEQEPAVGS